MLAQRIDREVPSMTSDELAQLYSTVIAFWSAGLLPHFTAEGECLLARLVRHVPAEDELVRRLQRDHLQIEALVASMRDASDLATRREALVGLGEALRAHVRWEEETLFPAAESTLTEDELDALGVDLSARLPEHPLPFDRSSRA